MTTTWLAASTTRGWSARAPAPTAGHAGDSASHGATSATVAAAAADRPPGLLIGARATRVDVFIFRLAIPSRSPQTCVSRQKVTPSRRLHGCPVRQARLSRGWSRFRLLLVRKQPSLVIEPDRNSLSHQGAVRWPKP